MYRCESLVSHVADKGLARSNADADSLKVASWDWFAIVGGGLLARLLADSQTRLLADSRAVALFRAVCKFPRRMMLSLL